MCVCVCGERVRVRGLPVCCDGEMPSSAPTGPCAALSVSLVLPPTTHEGAVPPYPGGKRGMR